MARRKPLHSVLSLPLSAISVHGSRGKSLIEQEVVDEVNILFTIHEDQGPRG